MSPKNSAIAFLFFSLALSLALSSSADNDNCPGYDSISDVLKHYELPGGLFPNNVESFSCEEIALPHTDALRLYVDLKGVCRVTRTADNFKNIVISQPHITATVSYRKLTNIKGINVQLLYPADQPVVNFNFPLEKAKVYKNKTGQLVLRYYAYYNLGQSPEFDVNKFPEEGPECDSAVNAVSKTTNQLHRPNWASEYGRLLPFVAFN